jgi:hypothetical protein
MGNKRAREFALQQQDALDWEHARTVPRPATADVHARGIGARRLQLIVCPAFGESRAWEVRQSEDEWRLYESDVDESWPLVQLVGYRTVKISSPLLAAYFQRVVALSLPVAPDLSRRAGADGTTTQLAVFGDLYSEWRFQWWSQSPAHWQPLVDLALEMSESFSAAGSQDAEGS